MSNSTALAKVEPPQLPAVVTMSFADKCKMAELLSKSDMLPKFQGRPGNVLLAIELACALRVNVSIALMNTHVIEGKATASSFLIGSLVRAAGHKMRVSGNHEKASVSIWRKDDPSFEYRSEWTIDRARKAGLLDKKGDTWKKYPDAMLKARATTECARDACPEALCGVQYTPEELGAEVDETENPLRVVADEAEFTVSEVPIKKQFVSAMTASPAFADSDARGAWVLAQTGKPAKDLTDDEMAALLPKIPTKPEPKPGLKPDAPQPKANAKASTPREDAKAAWYQALHGRLDEATATWWAETGFGFASGDDTLEATPVEQIQTATKALCGMTPDEIALILDDYRTHLLGDE